MVELGNRALTGGVVERLFLIQAPGRSGVDSSLRSEREAPLRFIGRSKELSDLEDLVTRYRLITLSGPAGVGKTTLLRRVLDEMDPLTKSWYLDVSNLASPTLLASALTDTLEIQKRPLQTHLEALLAEAEFIDGVLGLDIGARDLQEVRSVTRRLLAAAPNLAIVVVSPRSLGLPNESSMPLRGLELPKGPGTWQALREYDSVAFFESRAAAVVPEFRTSQDNAETIAIICRRLDGNPAALMLAINKLRVLSPRQILDRLDQPLVFLKGSEQGPERHQSLQKMIAVTVSPLSDEARTLLGCLSVVDGAVGLDDIEAMFPKFASLHAFEELVDAGLLNPDGANVDSRRFAASASVKEFARQTIPPDIYAEAVESRLSYYERVALESASGLAGKDQASWTRRIEEQCADISAVARVLIKQGELERASEMVASVLIFWFERNFPNEALALAEEILKKKKSFPSQARLENFAAVMALRLGDTAKATSYAKRGLERAIATGNKRFQIFLYGTLGLISLARDEFGATAENHRQAANIARESGETTLLYNSITNLLGSDSSTYRLDDFDELVEEALAIESDQSSSSWKARFRNNIANAALGRGDIVRAKAFAAGAIDLLNDSGHWLSAAVAVRTLAHALIREQRYSEAALLFGGANALVEQDEGRLNDYEMGLTHQGIKAIIEEIGQDAFQAQYNQGRMMEIDEILRTATSYALV